jgi:hypothetical protein
MGISVASDLETSSPPRSRGIEKLAIVGAKLLVTGACFWYVSRRAKSYPPSRGWIFGAAFALLLVMLQISLLGVRWCKVVDALTARDARMSSVILIAVTAMGMFFAQVLPSAASEGVRAWLLIRLGCDWRNAVTSVVIDRGIGVGLLVAIGFVILLLPSGLTALGGYRDMVLMIYGALLLAGVLALVFAPTLILPLSRWRYSRWFATLAVDARRVLLGPHGPMILGIGCLVHLLTIVVVWLLGRAQGLVLPLPDAAVPLMVMVGVGLVPISISGWGLRELAVVSLLRHHGVPPEQALLFSVCFGLTLAVGSLPGALAWLLYSFAPWRRSAEPRR